jgi:hypothetical protein
MMGDADLARRVSCVVCRVAQDCNNIPDVSQHRRRFEEHLKKNPSKAKTIKTLLARQNILMFERDKKQQK